MSAELVGADLFVCCERANTAIKTRHSVESVLMQEFEASDSESCPETGISLLSR